MLLLESFCILIALGDFIPLQGGKHWISVAFMWTGLHSWTKPH